MSTLAAARRRTWAAGLTMVLLLMQLVALYAPSAGSGGVPVSDKVVHAVIFAAPVVSAAVARWRWGALAVLLAVHAPLSELVQGALLPARSGDPWDVVADLVGVAGGCAAALLVTAARRRAGIVGGSSSRQAR
ncbi:VanZ family protein [Marihabitans asiaticum]|nr:VanZ family protein [Marihabitans asiaticum]